MERREFEGHSDDPVLRMTSSKICSNYRAIIIVIINGAAFTLTFVLCWSPLLPVQPCG